MQYAELVTVSSDGTIRIVIDGFHEMEQVLPFVDVLAIKQMYAEIPVKGWW